MNGLTIEAGRIFRRVLKMLRLITSTAQLLRDDQADAIAIASQDTSNPGSGTGGHSDPTPTLAHRLAPFAHWYRLADVALKGIDKALDEAERTFQQIIAESGRKEPPAGIEDRCPGWTPELRARLGGCGKVLEYHTLNSGAQVSRSEGLCAGCRSAQRRADALV